MIVFQKIFNYLYRQTSEEGEFCITLVGSKSRGSRMLLKGDHSDVASHLTLHYLKDPAIKQVFDEMISALNAIDSLKSVEVDMETDLLEVYTNSRITYQKNRA